LTLNTDALTIATAVKIIVDAAKAEEVKACGVDAINLLGKFLFNAELNLRSLKQEL